MKKIILLTALALTGNTLLGMELNELEEKVHTLKDKMPRQVNGADLCREYVNKFGWKKVALAIMQTDAGADMRHHLVRSLAAHVSEKEKSVHADLMSVFAQNPEFIFSAAVAKDKHAVENLFLELWDRDPTSVEIYTQEISMSELTYHRPESPSRELGMYAHEEGGATVVRYADEQ